MPGNCQGTAPVVVPISGVVRYRTGSHGALLLQKLPSDNDESDRLIFSYFKSCLLKI